MRPIDADALKHELVDDYERNDMFYPEYHSEALRIFSSIIDTRPTIGSWISVKDRLPKRPPNVNGLVVRREWYLVALESGAVMSLSYEFDDDRWATVGSPVTHWMPLPEPPTKGEA